MNVPLQLVMGITPAHRNQYLFSDHYLDNLLPQDPRWESALPQAEAFLTWLQGSCAQEQHQLRNYNETQLEEHWFKPILTQLGHVFEGQAGVPVSTTVSNGPTMSSSPTKRPARPPSARRTPRSTLPMRSPWVRSSAGTCP